MIRNVLFSLKVPRYDPRRPSPASSSCVTAQCRGVRERNHKTNRTRRMLVGPRQRGHRSKADFESRVAAAGPERRSGRDVGEEAQRVLALRPSTGRTHNVTSHASHNNLWPHGMHTRVARLPVMPSVRISGVRFVTALERHPGSHSNEENARQCNSARGVARRTG
jgi:hypothetical protein